MIMRRSRPARSRPARSQQSRSRPARSQPAQGRPARSRPARRRRGPPTANPPPASPSPTGTPRTWRPAMTEAEQNWPDGRPGDARPDERTGAQTEPAYEDDPIVEELYQADPPAEQAHREDPPAEQVHEAGPVAEQARVASPPAEQEHEGAAGPGSAVSTGQEPFPHQVRFDEAERLIARWREIQAGFVDEPRRAVQDADALVADLMDRLARMLASEREQLEPAGEAGKVSTEDLRQGLRRYRTLFERLLAV